ncbi:lipopolysaccharide biosynthesis protein [Agromyces soli]
MVNPSSSGRRSTPPPTTGSSTARATLHLLGAQFLRNLGPLLILLLLARLTDPETVGIYSLSLAIVTPFFVFAQLGMRTVTLTLRPEASFRNYVLVQSSALALALVAAVLFCAVGTPQLTLVVLLAAFMKVADAYSDFLSGPLQRHGRTFTVFIASLVAATVVSLIAAIVVALTRQLVPTLLALATTSLFTCYLLLFRPARSVSREAQSTTVLAPSSREIRRIFWAGLPLGISMSLMSLISTVPQYVVTASFGAAETARLAVLLYVFALADIVTGVVSQAWIPHAQEQLYRESPRASVLTVSRRALVKWTLIYIPVTIGGLFVAAWLVPIVFGHAYTLSLAEAVPLGLAIIVLPSAHFMATAVAIKNAYVHTLTLAIGSTVLSLGACLVLIPQLGIAGAFWALFVAVASRAIIATSVLALHERSGRRSAAQR